MTVCMLVEKTVFWYNESLSFVVTTKTIENSKPYYKRANHIKNHVTENEFVYSSAFNVLDEEREKWEKTYCVK